MKLEYNELINSSLVGFEFIIREQKMTNTSRISWESEYYIVTEDNGENCKVKNIETGTITEAPKTRIARYIDENPAMIWSEELNTYVNKISKI